MLRIIAFAIFAAGGLALLVGLGVWQVQRLGWKAEIIDRIEARIADDPVALPPAPDEGRDEYLPVRVEGRITGDPVRVLISAPGLGPAYRIVAPFDASGRSLLIDLGAIQTVPGETDLPQTPIRVVGNLLWPDEVDSFVPDPDLDQNIWFARDLPRMADHLGTEPLLVVAREAAVEGIAPQPITVAGIPNDHLQYAITWFSLAAIWAGMTVLLLWRMAFRPS